MTPQPTGPLDVTFTPERPTAPPEQYHLAAGTTPLYVQPAQQQHVAQEYDALSSAAATAPNFKQPPALAFQRKARALSDDSDRPRPSHSPPRELPQHAPKQPDIVPLPDAAPTALTPHDDELPPERPVDPSQQAPSAPADPKN